MNAAATHWKSLYRTDREFYELCYARAAEVYGDSYDDPEDAPAEIYVAFGAREALLALDQIDDEAKNIFGWGCCSFLAIALHELTGLPIALFTDPGSRDTDWSGWTGHVAVALPDGNFLDIEGVVSAADVNGRYRFSEPVAPVFPSWEGYLEIMFGSRAVSDPYRSLDPLEIRILEHFAELIARRANRGFRSASAQWAEPRGVPGGVSLP